MGLGLQQLWENRDWRHPRHAKVHRDARSRLPIPPTPRVANQRRRKPSYRASISGTFRVPWPARAIADIQSRCEASAFSTNDKDTDDPKAPVAYHQLYRMIEDYFLSGTTDPSRKVCRTSLPPLYFQHPGNCLTPPPPPPPPQTIPKLTPPRPLSNNRRLRETQKRNLQPPRPGPDVQALARHPPADRHPVPCHGAGEAA